MTSILFHVDAKMIYLTRAPAAGATTIASDHLARESREHRSFQTASYCDGKGNLKYLVVIALVALLVLLLLRRLRPYFRVVQQFIKALKHFQQLGATGANPRNQQPEKLVCCETCGTWIPSGRALTAGSKSIYCSPNCLETKSRPKQSAS